MLKADLISQSFFDTNLIHLIPDWAETFFDHITLKRRLSDTDLGVGVALALHHSSHHVVFGDQALGFQQDDSQQTLQEEMISFHSVFSVAPSYLLL